MTVSHKILILVNFSIFSIGIKSILEKEELLVMGEASHWDELFEILKIDIPDVILLDLPHCNNSGFASLEKLRKDYPGIPVLLFIHEGCSDFLRDFILIGIMGFAFRDTTLPELVKAIDRVANGREYFPDGILKLLKETLQSDRENLTTFNHHYQLTTREAAVCKLFCNGLTYKEIGSELYISPRTVETHRRNIFTKLKIKSTAELVKYAIRHNLS